VRRGALATLVLLFVLVVGLFVTLRAWVWLVEEAQQELAGVEP
jgi:hypothetical protein